MDRPEEDAGARVGPSDTGVSRSAAEGMAMVSFLLL
jgi:hypothetical protein